MKTKTKTQTSSWVHVPPTEATEPASEISSKTVQEFRNGLVKFNQIEKNTPMVKTIAYRAALDLDHLLRLLVALPSTILAEYKFNVIVKPKHKKDVRRFMAEAKKMRKAKWTRIK